MAESSVVGKVRNLGQVAALVSSTTAPTNKKILWYDENVSSGCPIKYFDLTTNTWTKLKD